MDPKFVRRAAFLFAVAALSTALLVLALWKAQVEEQVVRPIVIVFVLSIALWIVWDLTRHR